MKKINFNLLVKPSLEFDENTQMDFREGLASIVKDGKLGFVNKYGEDYNYE